MCDPNDSKIDRFITLRKTFIVQGGGNKLATLRSLFAKGERETERQRANMPCQGFACTRSFDTVLISTEGQKLECFNDE